MEFVGIYKEVDKWEIELQRATLNNPGHNILERYDF